MRSSLRIVSGRLRGRRIPLPSEPGFRPTGDRVREALFSILGDRVLGARVLDGYSGSGALGLEAWSRGAAAVLSVERDRERAEAIRRLHEAWQLPGEVSVVEAKLLHWLKEASTPRAWDLILADPPFDAGEAAGLVRRIGADPGLLAEDGLLVIERGTAPPARKDSVGELRKRDSRRYGSVFLDFWAREPQGPGESTGPLG